MTRRILVVGATGLIGAAVADALDARGDTVIRASRSGEEAVDLAEPASIAALYERVGRVDAVVNAAGSPPFGPLTELTPDDYRTGIAGKALGQIALVTQGVPFIADGGSFTLITGILTHVPIAGSSAAAAANGAVESFARAAATELPRGIRVNVVSPTVLEEARAYHEAFSGFARVSAAEVARAYVRSVDGVQTGQVFQLWG